MEEEISGRNIPGWAWVMGCLAIVVACAVIFALAAAAAGIWAVTSSQDDIAPVVAESETVGETPAASPDEQVAPADEVEQAESPGAAAPSPVPTLQADSSAAEESAVEEAGAEESDAEEGVAEEPAPNEITDPHAAERAAIEVNVAALRELAPKEEVTPTSLTPAELRQRLEEDLLEEYDPEQARQDVITLSAFDFMPADFELHSFVLDLLTEQIAGYYDPETDEFVIVSDDDEFGTLEQVAHAHEYVHALQDQYYDLELLDDDELDSEAAFALQALVEGEATFVQTLFMVGGYFDTGQLLDLLEESLTVDTAVLDSAPPILARELEFPYLTGLEFVQALHAQGGFEAVEAAWSDLPQSTEQILHPQRYLAGDTPQIVSVAPLTDTLGTGWELVEEDTLGEFYLREYLAQQLDGDSVQQAATGWGGDRYAVYWNEGDQTPVMVLRLAWDTAADAEEFAGIYPQYPERLYGSVAQDDVEGGRCWSGADVLCFFPTADESLIVRAPDLVTAAQVAGIQRAGG